MVAELKRITMQRISWLWSWPAARLPALSIHPQACCPAQPAQLTALPIVQTWLKNLRASDSSHPGLHSISQDCYNNTTRKCR